MSSPLFQIKTGVEKLRLTNFRCYETLSLTFDDDLSPVILTGNNGAGKTNILEAVSFLTAGRGLRSARLSDIARRVPITDFCETSSVLQLPTNWSVSADVRTLCGTVHVGTGRDETSERRQIRIDGQPVKTQSELAEVMSAIWLTPAMDRLFCGDPSSRRRFLDRLVQAFNPLHANLLTDYSYTLKQWNNLLKEGRYNDAWLSSLEETIAQNGVAIAAGRRDIVARLAGFLSDDADDLFPSAVMILKGCLEGWLADMPAVDVEERFKELLRQKRKICADGGNVEGAHTSDFSVIHRQKGVDAELCSTGEQKALLISIILAQTKAQMQEKGQCPVLLLDELGAHLDINRFNALLDRLTALPSQIWLTGTDVSIFEPLYGKAQFFNISDAKLNLMEVA